MDLMEIGTALREARERKGLSIEAVEERVKIAQSVIIALEEGNKDKFPHPVYARGFVRSYAILLGLDSQEMCAHFSREYPVPTDMDHHAETHGPHITVRLNESSRAPLAVWIVSALGVVVLGLGGWYAYDTYLKPRVIAQPAPAAEVAPKASSQSAPMTMQAPTQSAPLTQMQEISEDTANATAKSGQAGNVAMVTNASAVNVTAGMPEASVDGQKPGQLASEADLAGKRVMIVSARSASWLQAKADDKVTDYFLRKGESATLAFAKSLIIKFGNAGGVDLTLDGKPYPVGAKPGEVKTLVVK